MNQMRMRTQRGKGEDGKFSAIFNFYFIFFFTNYFGHNEFFKVQKIKFRNYAL